MIAKGWVLVETSRRAGLRASLDAFAWVKRDSYLPRALGPRSQIQLGYDQWKLMQDMVRFGDGAADHDLVLRVDAVATYYLYGST